MSEKSIELLQHVPHSSRLHAYSAVEFATNPSNSIEALEGTTTACRMRTCRERVVVAFHVRLPG